MTVGLDRSQRPGNCMLSSGKNRVDDPMAAHARAILLALLLVPGSLPRAGPRQQHGARANASANEFRGIFPALDALAAACKVRFGLEVLDDASDRGTVSLNLSCDDVPRTLNNIVMQRPGYEWAFDGGTYDIYPKDTDKRLSDLNVALYYVRDATADDNSDALDQLPEFRDWLGVHNARRRELLLGRRSQSVRRINLQLNAVPLRLVLNAITKALGDPHWMILHYGDKMRFVGIYF